MSHRKNKQFRIILASIILTISLGYFIRHIYQPTPISINQVGQESGSIELSLIPSTISIEPDTETTLNLIYTATKKLTGVQVEILYDESLITPLSVTPSSDFPTTLASPKFENGKITFAYGVAVNGDTGIEGNGTVAIIKIKSIKEGLATLSFTSNSIATALGSDLNELKTTMDKLIKIESIINPSPIASPTASPTSSPLASLEPIASPLKPPTPTDLIYNCYNNGSKITLRWSPIEGVDSYEIFLDTSDNSRDIKTTTTTKEIDLDINGNTTYVWTLRSVKDSVKSDEVKINEIRCAQISESSNTPSPSPTPTPVPTPSPIPSKKPISQVITNVFKKSPTPSLQPSTNPSESPLQTPNDPGSLSDVFIENTIPSDFNQEVSSPNFITKIYLGWQALFYRLLESISN